MRQRLINRRQGTINYVCLQVVLVACDGHDRLIKSKLMLLEGGLCYHTWPRNPVAFGIIIAY